MKQETGTKIKYGIWSFISGSIFAIVLGFAWGGWVTAGTAEELTGDAVVASQADICVAQFMMASDNEAKLAEFKAMQSWNHGEFIRKGGWDKMPGQEVANYPVSGACGKGIEAQIVN